MEYDIIAKNQLARLFQQSPERGNYMSKHDFRKPSKKNKSRERLSPVYLAKMQI